jgi:hypothetical protein
MAHITQDEKKVIAPIVKDICKKYGVKGSLSIRHHSTIVLTIASGELDFIGNYNKVAGAFHRNERFSPATESLDINVYWYEKHFDGKVKEFLSEVIPALKGKGWFDKSDIMTDYFHVKHYFDVQVGKWNKPYQLVK